MQRRFTATDITFASALALIGGYIAGGWVYAITGTALWTVLKEWQEVLVGAAAIVAAVAAAAAAWKSIQLQIAANRADTDRQIAEQRRQFQHHMMVAIGRERNEILKALYDKRLGFHVVRRYIEDVRQRFADGTAGQEVAQVFRPMFLLQAKGLDEWLEDPASRNVTSILTVEQRAAIRDYTVYVGIVAADGAPALVPQHIATMRDLLDKAEDAIEQARLSAEALIPVE